MKDSVSKFPTSCEGVPDEILQPRQTWPDKKRFDNVANLLAQMFIEKISNNIQMVVVKKCFLHLQKY